MTPDAALIWLETNDTVAYEHYTYNLQNRLAQIDKYSTYDTLSESVEYRYNTAGVRISKVQYPDGAAPKLTTYLIDPYNHTGYAQVLSESTYDITTPASPALIESITYTIGDDIISQDSSVSGVKYLLYDGHGSTRQLVASDGSTINESYSYDAYGVMLGGNPQTPAATNLLYSGEQFDTSAQQYYLRARYYNQNNGTFNRVDPYAGNMQDPQSLHKYAYVHNNPVNAIDPSGMFSLVGINISMSIGNMMDRINLAGVYKAYDFADTTITAINLLQQWRSTGRADYLSLGLLAASLIPFGKIMRKVKFSGRTLVGASDDLTKMFRKAGSRTNKLVQTIGEMGAELTARAKGFLPSGFSPAYHGFDDIYRNGKRFVIVEAKGGTSRLAENQMSRLWIEKNIRKMANNPANSALADELMRAWKQGAVDAMVVTTKIAGDQVQDPEFVFKAFAEIGETAF